MGTLPYKLIHLLNEFDVAEMLGVSVATVRRWRLFRQGPVYRKIGVLCKYKVEDVLAFIDSRPTGGGQQKAR